MAATEIEAEIVLPYESADLCRLVGDVTSYPTFIPYVKSIDVIGRKPLEDGWQGLARAAIGWRSVQERFATYVRCVPSAGTVDVKLAEGPFKSLDNRWRFTPDGRGGSKVRFEISYEFKNPILQALAALNKKLAADRIISAFTAEAHRRFGSSGRDHPPQQT